MDEKKEDSVRKIRYYFLIAAVLVSLPHIFSFYSGQTGYVLVATKEADNDPHFSKSVVYIFYNGIWGAQGIILNSPLSLKETPFAEEDTALYKLFKGGPVAFPVYKLVALDSPSRASRWRSQPLTVTELRQYNIYRDSNIKTEQAEIMSNVQPPLYFGFSSWITGQLEAEIKHGVWRVLKCDTPDFSDIGPSDLWEYLNGDLAGTSCQPIN